MSEQKIKQTGETAAEADENKAAFLSAGISGKTAPTDGSVRYTHGSDCKKWLPSLLSDRIRLITGRDVRSA